jgi:hypothetical protein
MGRYVGQKSNSKEDKQTLKEKKKKNPCSGNIEFQSSEFSLQNFSSGVTPLAFRPVCLGLLGRFGAGIWWCWSPPASSV